MRSKCILILVEEGNRDESIEGRDGVNPADVQRTGDNNESSSSKNFAEHTATEAGMDDFRMLKALVLGIKYYDS